MKRKVDGNPTIVVLEFYGIIGGGQAVIGKYTMNALRKFIERNIVQCVMVFYTLLYGTYLTAIRRQFLPFGWDIQ